MLGIKLLIVISVYFLSETQEVKCLRPPISLYESKWRRSRSHPTIPTQDNLHGFICPLPFGYHPVSTSCDAYIECKNNIPVQYKCPYGLYYSPNAQWPNFPCMKSQTSRCRRSLINKPRRWPETRNWLRPSPPQTNTPANVLYDYYCEKANTYYPLSTRCDAYVECKNYVAMLYKCPAGLYYASDIQWPNIPCNYPWLVFQNGRCGGIPIAKPTHELDSMSPTITESTPQSNLPNTSTTNLIIVYPENYQDTPNEERTNLSDPMVGTTGAPTEVEVLTSTISLESTWRPPIQLFNYTCQETNGFYLVSTRCEAYVECKDHAAIQYECPTGLYYDPTIQWPNFPCNYPSKVQCENITENDNSTKCPELNGYFPMDSNSDCAKYIMCEEGRAIVMNCPTGLAFNFNTSSCDWPVNVPGCTPNAFEDFTCPPLPIDSDDNTIKKYRYKESCSIYVACQKERPRLLRCDAGLSFDEKTETCVDSKLVLNCIA